MTDSATIKRVQIRLLELGYTGGGPPDGAFDLKTQGSILNFRNRNGLPLTPAIDAELLAALEVAPKIELPIQQTTANVGDIAPKVEAVQKTWWASMWAHILAWPSLAITALGVVLDNAGDAIEKLTPLKTFVGDYLAGTDPFRLVLLCTASVTVVAFVIAWQNGSAQRALVKGYRDGTVRNDTAPMIKEGIEGKSPS